ncbi:putative membrane protein [Lysobacter dokdonensis DS-58]|uniref:Putative membrane protein n=1 Tax=Lysobacter dokdonensis DS-58 TaxID=1300345 RepID=A0A0A2WMM8_9GAMM|nr:hypothetical protein [Lysobacter dokdonensis]KGQ19987.1 putative membrane protein [Lysobacter dokdonensis DS-58]
MSAASRAVSSPEPFWHRIPSIILYPLRGAALITLVMLAVLALFRIIPVVGWILGGLMWLGAYKYAFEILRRSADGDMEAPEIVMSVDNGVVWRFLAMQFVMILFVVGLALTGSMALVVAGLVLVVFLQPAVTMTLAMTGSLSDALNPSMAFAVVGRVGWPYLAVVGLLFVIQASALTAGAWLGNFMPPFAAGWVSTVLAFWGLFSAFHLMGYLVYQAHEELGYDPATMQADAARPTLTTANDIAIAQAEPLIREGRMQDAIALLRTEVRTRAVSVEVHDLYRRLLQKAGDPQTVQEHARQYLHQLMMEKQDRKALGLLRECLDADPSFVPLLPEHGARLAEQARLGGQAQLAVDILHALFNANPSEPASAHWGLTAAMLLLERFNRNAEAKVLLERARSRTTDADLLKKIDSALSLT